MEQLAFVGHFVDLVDHQQYRAIVRQQQALLVALVIAQRFSTNTTCTSRRLLVTTRFRRVQRVQMLGLKRGYRRIQLRVLVGEDAECVRVCARREVMLIFARSDG
jgi:hypothetical protein